MEGLVVASLWSSGKNKLKDLWTEKLHHGKSICIYGSVLHMFRGQLAAKMSH